MKIFNQLKAGRYIQKLKTSRNLTPAALDEARNALVAMGPAAIERQAAENHYITLERFECLQCWGQIEILAGFGRRPTGHDVTVGSVDEDTAKRGLCCCGRGSRFAGGHGFKQRQSHGGA